MRRKYRYHICFRNGGTDVFSTHVCAGGNSGNKSVRDKLAINHSKMLAYAGIGNAGALAGCSAQHGCPHCFDLPDVAIENWLLRKVPVDPDQQNRLGVRHLKTAGYVPGRSVIGINFTLGASSGS